MVYPENSVYDSRMIFLVFFLMKSLNAINQHTCCILPIFLHEITMDGCISPRNHHENSHHITLWSGAIGRLVPMPITSWACWRSRRRRPDVVAVV